MLLQSSQVICNKLLGRHVVARGRAHRIRELCRESRVATTLGRIKVQLEPLMTLSQLSDLEAPFIVVSVVLKFSVAALILVACSKAADKQQSLTLVPCRL